MEEIDVARFRQLLARIDRKGLVELAERKLNGDTAWTSHSVPDSHEPSHEADDDRTVQERCEHEVICQLIRREVAEEFATNPLAQVSDIRPTALKLIEKNSIESRIRAFGRRFPNARHEMEYALFTGREEGIKPLTITQRKTVSSLGTIPIFRGGDIGPSFLDDARAAALRGLLDGMESGLFSGFGAIDSKWGANENLVRRVYTHVDAIRTLGEKETLVLKAMAIDSGPDARGANGYAVKAREVLIDRALLTCCREQRKGPSQNKLPEPRS